MLRNGLLILSLGFCLISCGPTHVLKKYGKAYQDKKDYVSLKKFVDQIPLGTDKTLLTQYLGEAIDMGFDYRFLIDSVGPQGCAMGAVFHLDELGKVDQKWLDEICE